MAEGGISPATTRANDGEGIITKDDGPKMLQRPENEEQSVKLRQALRRRRRQAEETDTSAAASIKNDTGRSLLVETLQAELDRLSIVAKQSDEMVQKILRLRDEGGDNAGTTALEDDAETEQYDAEIVESYKQLVEMNAVLRQDAKREQARWQKAMDHAVELSETLATMQSICPDEKPIEKAGEDAVNLSEENRQLKDDLKYVATFIEEKLKTKEEAHDTEKQQPTEEHGRDAEIDAVASWTTLDELLQQLIQRLLDSPEDPYLLVNSVDSVRSKRHLELLKRCFIVETWKDNEDLIKLTDYRT